MDQSGYGGNYKYAFSTAASYSTFPSYSLPASVQQTPTVQYVTDENGVSTTVWAAPRTHAASFSAASGSSASYPPLTQRSYSNPGWPLPPRSVPQQTTPYSTASYPEPNGAYANNACYAQENLSSSYYPPQTTGFAPPANTGAPLAPISTNNTPHQVPGFLSPYPATSPVAASFGGRRSSEPSNSPSSEDFPHEHRTKRNRYHGCLQCNKSFRRKADLGRHETCVHRKEEAIKYFCDAKVCDRNVNGSHGGFTRKDHLTEHLRNFHHREIPKRLKMKGLEGEPATIQPNRAVSYLNNLQANEAATYPDDYGDYTAEPDAYQDGESEISYHRQPYSQGEG